MTRRPTKWMWRGLLAVVCLGIGVAVAQAPAIVQLFDSDAIWVLRNGVTVPANMISVKQYVAGGGAVPVGQSPHIIPSLFDATNTTYGTCTWSATGDAAPCINNAIAIAGQNGGGTVVLPCGKYGIAAEVVQNTSGVGLKGCGVGTIHDNLSGSAFPAYTTLVWTGVAGGTMMYVGPATPYTSTTKSLYSTNLLGIALDCQTTANVGLDAEAVNASQIDFGAANCRTNNMKFIAPAIADSPGLQHNDMWLRSVEQNAAYSPVGILFDSVAGSNWNFSLNRVHLASAFHFNGDGVVFGNSDHNTIDVLNTFHFSTGSGRSAVFANAAYVMSNGQSVNGFSGANYVIKNEAFANILGFETGSTLVAGLGNQCSGCGPTTITKATTSNAIITGTFLPFTDVTNLASGLTVNCGTGAGAEVVPNSYIGGLRTGVGAYFYFPRPLASDQTLQGPIGTVPSGTQCVFSYGVSKLAATGTYTITADAGGATVDIAAPTGGHSQTGVAISGGFIRAIDFVIPFAGVPTVGDSWTLTVPQPSKHTRILSSDSGNNVFGPNAEPGASLSTGNDFAAPVGYDQISKVGAPIDFTLSATSVGGAAITLTADGTGVLSGSNCGAIQGNTQMAFTAVLNAFDVTTAGTGVSSQYVTASWGGGQYAQHVLARGDLVSSIRLDNSASAINADIVKGVSGSTQTLTANGNVACLSASFTPPNSDNWQASLRVVGTVTP